MPASLYHVLADELYAAFAAHTPTELISARYPALTAEEAYAVQRINQERALSMGWSITGYKVGLTAQELMRSMQVNEPDYGVLYDAMALPANGDAPFDRMFEPKVEGEIAFHLAADLPEAATADDVLAALDYVTASFEFPETRIAGWRNKIADTVADNSSAGHYMLSTQRIAVSGLDFSSIHLTLRKNGKPLADGTADVILGNPLNSVAWLNNKLHTHGSGLKKGQVVLAGALCGAHLAAKGDTFEAEFDTLGKLSVSFR